MPGWICVSYSCGWNGRIVKLNGRKIAKQFSVRFSIGKISTELKKFRTLWTFVPCVFCKIIVLKNFCLILVCAFMSDFYFCIILCLILCHINFVGLNICFLFYLCLSDFLCYLCECDFLFGVIFVCLTVCPTLRPCCIEACGPGVSVQAAPHDGHKILYFTNVPGPALKD